MKQEKQKITSDKKIHSFNLFFVNVQVLFTVLTVILFIVYIFKREVWMFLQLSLGIDLLVMAYNNQVIYQRKKITVLYASIGTILLILDILLWLGV